MLYLSSSSDRGLIVYLGISDENIEQIKLDNPLMARLSYVGYTGLFFLFATENADDSPAMIRARTALAQSEIL